MAHDFAKTRTRKVPEQKRPEPTPQPTKGLLLTGLLTGLVLGVFISFLIYISGMLPPVNPMADTTDSSNAEELAVAQQRRNEELEQAAARLQLEFYKELPNYEIIVDNTPGTVAATSSNTMTATAAEQAIALAQSQAQNQPMPATPTLVAGQEPVATVITNFPAATVATSPSSDTITPVVTGSVVDSPAVAPIVPVAAIPGEPSFMIQAGAFQQEAAAVAQTMRLNALGLDARVKKEALLGQTLFLVQSGPYSSRDQLSQLERILRSNGIDSMRIGVNQ
ncbi:MAG: SPOR domain-containing protein [Gammaproteobacteria bacterium]|nr:SPOR domain-containing protein [Gammaproteobacteria bacterium]